MVLRQLTLLLICGLMLSAPAQAARNLFDHLAMTWNSFDDFVTAGLCASAPMKAALYNCNPAFLAEVQEHRFDAAVFLSATDSVLTIVDTLKNAPTASSQSLSDSLNKIFTRYNYSELIFSPKIFYVDRGFSVGIHPKKITAQFEVHNPNLPLTSIAMREETNLNLGFGYGIKAGVMKLNVGTSVTVLTQSESIAEATLLSIASTPPNQLIQTQQMAGLFADAGAVVSFNDVFSISAMFKDIGRFWIGTDRSNQFLFIYPNRVPRVAVSASWTPALWHGRFQIGLQLISLLYTPYAISDEWSATISYFLGPLRILSTLRPDLIRTGIGLQLADFEASVAQEWLNQVETGRQNQPRFILGVSLGL